MKTITLLEEERRLLADVKRTLSARLSRRLTYSDALQHLLERAGA